MTHDARIDEAIVTDCVTPALCVDISVHREEKYAR